MKRILVVVDMQNDFTTGVLGNEDCKNVIDRVIDLINDAYDEILVTRDTHGENYLETNEGKNLPVAHCIEGTEGWNIVPQIENALSTKNNVEYFNKPTFGSTDLAEYLRHCYLDENDEISIDFCGVYTGICVISNVMLAKANCPEAQINVIANACACVTPQSHQTAIEAMKLCHIKVI